MSQSDSDTETRPGPAASSSAWIYELRKEELQRELAKYGLETTGTVSVLRQRLAQLLVSARKMLAGATDTRATDGATDTAESAETPYANTGLRTPVHVCETVRKWNVQFDGKSDPVSFMERLAELKQSYQIQDAHLLEALPELFRGTALNWLRNNREYWTNWPEFVAEFQAFYLPADYRLQLEEQIASRKQKPGEKGRDYVIDVRTLIRRHGGMTKEQEMYRVYCNLLPEYRQYIRRRDVPDIRALVREIDELENLHRELRGTRASRSTTSGPADALAQISSVQSPHSRADNRVYVDVAIHDVIERALLDTGAMLSYINTATLQRLRVNVEEIPPASHSQAQLADGTVVKTQGEMTLGCAIEGVYRRVAFTHLPGLTTAIVLGMDAIGAFGIVIDAARNQVRLNNPPPILLAAAEPPVLPAPSPPLAPPPLVSPPPPLVSPPPPPLVSSPPPPLVSPPPLISPTPPPLASQTSIPSPQLDVPRRHRRQHRPRNIVPPPPCLSSVSGMPLSKSRTRWQPPLPRDEPESEPSPAIMPVQATERKPAARRRGVNAATAEHRPKAPRSLPKTPGSGVSLLHLPTSGGDVSTPLNRPTTPGHGWLPPRFRRSPLAQPPPSSTLVGIRRWTSTSSRHHVAPPHQSPGATNREALGPVPVNCARVDRPSRPSSRPNRRRRRQRIRCADGRYRWVTVDARHYPVTTGRE